MSGKYRKRLFSSILLPEKFDISNFNPELFSLKNFCSFLIKFKVLKVFFKIESYIWDTFHHQYFVQNLNLAYTKQSRLTLADSAGGRLRYRVATEQNETAITDYRGLQGH